VDALIAVNGYVVPPKEAQRNEVSGSVESGISGVFVVYWKVVN
jgi:hypothetical protein